jgi:hypothetical protein
VDNALQQPKKQGAAYRLIASIVNVVVSKDHDDARATFSSLQFQILRFRYYQIVMPHVHQLGLNLYGHAGPRGGRVAIAPERGCGFDGSRIAIEWGAPAAEPPVPGGGMDPEESQFGIGHGGGGSKE